MLKQKFSIAPLSILVFLTSSCLVAGQVIKPGSCRTDIKYLSSVDSKAYQGSWYMQTRYLFVYEQDYRCQKTDYTPGPNNDLLVRNTEISNVDESEKVRTGTLKFLPDGQLQIKYNEADAGEPFDYKVLSVDYDNYVIIYACQNLLWSHAEYVWIRTRDPNPSQIVKDAYIADLSAQNITTNELVSTRQEKCANYETMETKPNSSRKNPLTSWFEKYLI
ncbi:apolipoprotein D-like isoform X2 [Eurosta solidaginis]|uniref:apolipoprotein D-like n=1 Tax=Eurosta solidaginis TaxID=178769 RepID=UPI0035305992